MAGADSVDDMNRPADWRRSSADHTATVMQTSLRGSKRRDGRAKASGRFGSGISMPSLLPASFGTCLRAVQRLGNGRRRHAGLYRCTDDLREVLLFRAAYCHDDGHSSEEPWQADAERYEYHR